MQQSGTGFVHVFLDQEDMNCSDDDDEGGPEFEIEIMEEEAIGDIGDGKFKK